jgi:RimJ/RimL family protein N-acetyltransferase
MTIKVKKATAKDIFFFYKLRNEYSTRKYFFNRKYIKYADHIKWYVKNLKNKSTILIVGRNNKKKIGIIKFFKEKQFTNVSIIIDKKFRNHGYGTVLLKKAERLIKTKTTLISKIKKKNKRSIKVFIKNNYVIFKKRNVYIYKKKINL